MKNSTFYYYIHTRPAHAHSPAVSSPTSIYVSHYIIYTYILYYPFVCIAYNNILYFIHTRRREKDTREPMAGSDTSIYYVLIRYYYI